MFLLRLLEDRVALMRSVKILLAFFFVAIALPAVAKDKNSKVKFEYSAYQDERAIVYLEHKEDFEEFAKMQKDMGEIVDKPEIGIALYDLNNDGIKDVLAYIRHKFYCGSHGCAFEIYLSSASGEFKRTADERVVYGNVQILDHQTKGMHDICFDESKCNVLQWNGNKYN